MEKKPIVDMEPYCTAATTCKSIGSALGAETLTAAYYELEPGDSFLFGGYHRRETREEIFVIRQGTVTFETEDDDVEVEAGEALRVAPGEWRGGTNEGTERVIALVVGAPRDAPETTILRECPECGERTSQDFEMSEARDLLTTYCETCGTETEQLSE